MKPEDVLRDLGLTETETKVYLALLKLGETTAPEIVKNTKTYKANVYDALNKLEKKGLATHIKKEYKLFYSPLNPEKLFGILEGKKEDLNSVFPLLKKFYKAERKETEINVLFGKEGIKTIFKDIFDVNKEVLIIGSSLQLFSIMEHRIFPIVKNLKKSKIKLKGIFANKKEVREQVKKLKNQLPLKVGFYSENYFSPVAFATYGDRFVMQIWKDEPLAIWIKDKYIATSFKNYFDIIWKVSKK